MQSKIKKLINDSQSILLLTHESPDGDAVGSSLALYNALKDMGKKPDVIIPEYSRCFDFLPGCSEIKKESDRVIKLLYAILIVIVWLFEAAYVFVPANLILTL